MARNVASCTHRVLAAASSYAPGPERSTGGVAIPARDLDTRFESFDLRRLGAVEEWHEVTERLGWTLGTKA